MISMFQLFITAFSPRGAVERTKNILYLQADLAVFLAVCVGAERSGLRIDRLSLFSRRRRGGDGKNKRRETYLRKGDLLCLK